MSERDAKAVLHRNGFVYSGQNLINGRIVRIKRSVLTALVTDGSGRYGIPGERGQLCVVASPRPSADEAGV